LTARQGGGPPASRGWIDSGWFRSGSGWLIAQYVKLVARTNRIERDPPELEQRRAVVELVWPAIFTSWHANVLAVPIFMEKGLAPGEVVGLAAPHADGRLAAAVMHALGFRTITGTGATERQREGTGGTQALRAMIRELEEGRSVYITAEIPPIPGRRVSMGLIALARASGRPIISIAAASSRRTILERIWDKMQINHPFGKLVLLFDGPIYVNDQISNEEARDRVKRLLDDSYAEALRRADS